MSLKTEDLHRGRTLHQDHPTLSPLESSKRERDAYKDKAEKEKERADRAEALLREFVSDGVTRSLLYKIRKVLDKQRGVS